MTESVAMYLQAGGGYASLLMMVAVFAVFYFLLIMPQQKRQKKWQEMLNKLKPGDRVTTSGGLQGTILSMRSPEGEVGTLVLRVPPDNLKIEVTRNSIVSVKTSDES